MDYLNRANGIITNANTMYNNASNMLPANTLRYPPVSNQGLLKETFYDPMNKSDWFLVFAMVIFLFMMLYWVYSKKKNESMLL
jgi:hypothetical protein